MSNIIKFPDTFHETAETIKSFHEFADGGAIDGTHNELSPWSGSRLNYFLRKQKYIINTQVVVGSNFMFFDIISGISGTANDARMLRSCSLYRKCGSTELRKRPSKVQPCKLYNSKYMIALT